MIEDIITILNIVEKWKPCGYGTTQTEFKGDFQFIITRNLNEKVSNALLEMMKYFPEINFQLLATSGFYYDLEMLQENRNCCYIIACEDRFKDYKKEAELKEYSIEEIYVGKICVCMNPLCPLCDENELTIEKLQEYESYVISQEMIERGFLSYYDPMAINKIHVLDNRNVIMDYIKHNAYCITYLTDISGKILNADNELVVRPIQNIRTGFALNFLYPKHFSQQRFIREYRHILLEIINKLK